MSHMKGPLPEFSACLKACAKDDKNTPLSQVERALLTRYYHTPSPEHWPIIKDIRIAPEPNGTVFMLHLFQVCGATSDFDPAKFILEALLNPFPSREEFHRLIATAALLSCAAVANAEPSTLQLA